MLVFFGPKKGRDLTVASSLGIVGVLQPYAHEPVKGLSLDNRAGSWGYFHREVARIGIGSASQGDGSKGGRLEMHLEKKTVSGFAVEEAYLKKTFDLRDEVRYLCASSQRRINEVGLH